MPLLKPLEDGSLLSWIQSGLAPQLLPFGSGPLKPGLRSLDKQVSFEFSDRRDDRHRHLSGGAGEIDAAKGQTMNTDAQSSEFYDSLLYVDCVASEPIELCDYQYVPLFKTVEQLREACALTRGDATAHALRDDAPLVDLEARRRNLRKLVGGGLVCGADAGVKEGTAHFLRFPRLLKIGVRIMRVTQNMSTLIFEHGVTACSKALGFVRSSRA